MKHIVLTPVRLWRQLSLLMQFTLTGLFLTIAIGAVLGWGVGRELERSALAQEAESAADQVILVLNPFLREEDFSSPLSDERYWEIDRLLRERVIRSHIVRVKIWNADGVVVYSDDQEVVGQQFGVQEGLSEALEGRTATEMTDLSKPENQAERGRYERLMEIYVPIDLGGNNVVGVYELYHELAIVQPRIAAMQQFVWISLVVGLGALYVALFGVVQRASHQLRIQNERVARAEARREVDRLQSEFVSIVSHELRTPLTSLVGFSELLLTQQVDEDERREWTTMMHVAAERLTNLVAELLDVTRIEEGRIELNPQPLDIKAAVTDVVTGFHPQTPVHRLEQWYAEPLPPVMADPDKLTQILTNLVSNAIKYSPQGGPVTISAEARNGSVHLSVTDCGLGLPADELPYLFGRFHRIHDESRQEIQGSGLGLYITKELVELQGGRIWAESPGPGKGSSFHVELPAALVEASSV